MVVADIGKVGDYRYILTCRFSFQCTMVLGRHPYAGSTATQAEPGDLPGLLAWHIILIVAQPGRKRGPDAAAGEPPAFGKIVEDHFSRVFV